MTAGGLEKRYGADTDAGTFKGCTTHNEFEDLLARSEIDAVLNLSSAEMEWDTCAPEVILTEAGCTVTDGDGNPFRYNQRDLYRRRGSVASNGKCHNLMLRVMAPCLPEPGP